MTNTLHFTSHMSLALAEAKQAYLEGEIPVGAVIINNEGKCIASAHNKVVQHNNPLHHAEILAMDAASRILGPSLNQCDLYVTLEPCAMCAQAMSYFRIRRLYFAADSNTGYATKVLQHTNHKPEVYSGFMREESSALLEKFFQQMRDIKQ